jgi:hypothetical protein
MMKLELKDISYDSKRISTPARGSNCDRSDAPVFELYSHVRSKVSNDWKAQTDMDMKHQRDPGKHKRNWHIFGAWACPFCGKKMKCGCGWVDLEIDPTVQHMLRRVPRHVDQVQVYCPCGDASEPPRAFSAAEGGVIPFELDSRAREVRAHFICVPLSFPRVSYLRKSDQALPRQTRDERKEGLLTTKHPPIRTGCLGSPGCSESTRTRRRRRWGLAGVSVGTACCSRRR